MLDWFRFRPHRNLKTDRELIRIEIPGWIAQENSSELNSLGGEGFFISVAVDFVAELLGQSVFWGAAEFPRGSPETASV